MPIFVNEALVEPEEIKSLPGIYQHSIVSLNEECREISDLGIKAVILFGIPKEKDAEGSEADNPDGIIQKAIRRIKEKFPHLVVIADCCLCEYTAHGHCGIMEDGALLNDPTLDRLHSVALSYAEAGADIIAPSGMMDGMVGEIRYALESNGHYNVGILSYSSKFSSALYGPFRDAAGSADNFKGDRRHHQLGPGQRREAIREAAIDEDEGADMLMVKPATLYLDIIRDIRDNTMLPLFAYHVSGEYAALENAIENGIMDREDALRETFISIKRAGADTIITYYAKALAKILA
jgi:porphobilinogen synthase